MPDLDYAKVVGRFGITIGDGPDPDELPDTIWCDEGKVRLVPLQSPARVPGGTPVPWTGGKAVIEATLNTDGYLTFNAKPYVWVVDLTSEKINPHIGPGLATHRVEFEGIKADGIDVTFNTSTVRLAADTMVDGECDLTLLMPVQVGPGTAIVVGDRGVSVTGVVQETPDTFALELSDGTTTDAVELVPGPPGGVNEVAGLQGDVTKEDLFDELEPLVSAQIEEAGSGYDIVILAGQSNMSGRGTGFTTTTDPVNPRVFQLKSRTPNKDTVIAAAEPLNMHDTPSGIGPGLQFARWYGARRLASNRKVLLVPVAHGGTRLVTTATPLGWRRGVAGNLYEFMLTQAQTALAKAALEMPDGDHRIVAALWCQGESDGDNAVTGADYQIDFDALIAGLRVDLNLPELPFVVLTLMPQYLGTGTRRQIDAVHRETPLRVARADVAVGQSGAGSLADGNHYDAAQQRLNGRAMFDAYDRIAEGLSPYFEEFRPAAVGTLTVTPNGSALGVAWTASARASSYLVEYREAGSGGTWSSGGTTTTPSRSVTGLTNGTSYEVRVIAQNLGASAAPSPTATGTPVATTTLGVGATALGAYSPSRRVVSNYSGPLVRVRRSSDNAEQDIAQASGALDTAALATFLGSSDGFVTRLYDQSGSGKNIAQTASAAQPRIATAGTPVTSGGKVALTFDGTDDVLTIASQLGLYDSAGVTACQVTRASTPGAQKRTWVESFAASSGNQYGLLQPDIANGRGCPLVSVGTTSGGIVGQSVTGAGTLFDGAIHQASATDTTTAMAQWMDGAVDLASTAYSRPVPVQAHDTFSIGGVVRSGSLAPLAMTFSELVVWGTVLSGTDRQLAEANQKAFYGTP